MCGCTYHIYHIYINMSISGICLVCLACAGVAFVYHHLTFIYCGHASLCAMASCFSGLEACPRLIPLSHGAWSIWTGTQPWPVPGGADAWLVFVFPASRVLSRWHQVMTRSNRPMRSWRGSHVGQSDRSVIKGSVWPISSLGSHHAR